MKLTDLHLSQRRTSEFRCGRIMLLGMCCSVMYVNLTVAHKRVTEHVIMLKQIFDKQDSIF